MTLKERHTESQVAMHEWQWVWRTKCQLENEMMVHQWRTQLGSGVCVGHLCVRHRVGVLWKAPVPRRVAMHRCGRGWRWLRHGLDACEKKRRIKHVDAMLRNAKDWKPHPQCPKDCGRKDVHGASGLNE